MALENDFLSPQFSHLYNGEIMKTSSKTEMTKYRKQLGKGLACSIQLILGI